MTATQVVHRETGTTGARPLSFSQSCLRRTLLKEETLPAFLVSAHLNGHAAVLLREIKTLTEGASSVAT